MPGEKAKAIIGGRMNGRDAAAKKRKVHAFMIA